MKIQISVNRWQVGDVFISPSTGLYYMIVTNEDETGQHFYLLCLNNSLIYFNRYSSIDYLQDNHRDLKRVSAVLTVTEK